MAVVTTAPRASATTAEPYTVAVTSRPAEWMATPATIAGTLKAR